MRGGRFEKVNDAFCEKTGYERGEVIGKKVGELPMLQDADREKVMEGFERRANDEKIPPELELPYTVQYETKEGEERYGEINTKFLKKDGKFIGTVGIVRDTTERQNREKELEKRKEEYKNLSEKFESLFEESPDAVGFVDGDGIIREVNDEACEQLEIDREELVGMPLKEQPFYSGEDREKFLERAEEVFEGKDVPPTTYELETANGNKRYVEVNHSIITEDGEFKGLILIGRDITERKKAEEREEFLHSLLRHDLKNKAQVIRGYLEKMRGLDFPEKAELYLGEAIKTNKNEKELIEKVRSLRKIEESKVEKVEINSVLNQVIAYNKEKANEKSIHFEKDISNCEVQGGPLLEELFSNLIENSITHSECGKIRIIAKEKNDECIVSVIDDGIGIPYEKKSKILKKGFKGGEEAGFGLGLYLVEEIVENYRGHVEVKDSEFGGTRVDVHLNKA